MTAADAADFRRRDGLGRMHPLDLPPIVAPARRAYLVGLLLQQVSSPRVLVALSALLMAVSNNPVTPLVGPWLTLALVLYVARRFDSDAWAYIPRREQDTARPAPAPWLEIGVIAQVVVLAAGLATYLAAAQARPEAMGASVVAGLAAVLGVRELVLLMRRSGADAHGALRWFVVTAARAASLVVCIVGVVGALQRADRAPFDAWELAAGGIALLTALGVWRLLSLMPERVRCTPQRGDL